MEIKNFKGWENNQSLNKIYSLKWVELKINLIKSLIGKCHYQSFFF